MAVEDTIIEWLTPSEIRYALRGYNFSNNHVPRFLTPYSSSDIFACEIVTQVMREQNLPHIPTLYMGCIGQPPNPRYSLTLKKAVTKIVPMAWDIPSVEALVNSTELLDYRVLKRYMGCVVHFGHLQYCLENKNLLIQLVIVAVLGALGYSSGLKRAPCQAVNYIRYVFRVFKLTGFTDDDLYEALEHAALCWLS